MGAHGRTTVGRGHPPCACLPVSMRPHGRPRSLDGSILCPACLQPWDPMAVRVGRSGTRFRCTRTPITPHGCAHGAGWLRASERRGHRCSRMGASFPSTRAPLGPTRTGIRGKGWSLPRDGYTHGQGWISACVASVHPTRRRARPCGVMDSGMQGKGWIRAGAGSVLQREGSARPAPRCPDRWHWIRASGARRVSMRRQGWRRRARHRPAKKDRVTFRGFVRSNAEILVARFPRTKSARQSLLRDTTPAPTTQCGVGARPWSAPWKGDICPSWLLQRTPKVRSSSPRSS